MITNDNLIEANPDSVIVEGKKPETNSTKTNPVLDKLKARLIANKNKKLTIKKEKIFIIALIFFLLGRLSINYLH